MRILVLTQIVDTHDPFLGFFHAWLEEFSQRFEAITVVCLKEGEHSLPENVQVHSLGKEDGVGRMEYIRRFFAYIWKFRSEYSSVFVHMNHEYVLLGGWLWRLMGKKVTLWRNHFAGNVLVDFAALFCHKVFCTSKYSYTAKYAKTVFMPVGAPEKIFYAQKNVERKPNSILSLVRISPAKKLEQLIDALALLRERGVDYTAHICGDTTPELKEYEEMLHAKVKDKQLEQVVTFSKGVPYVEVPEQYSRNVISVNQSPSGMYDKTLFEAMLCETLVLSCNENLRGEIDDLFVFTEDSVEELADKLEHLLRLGEGERKRLAAGLREYALSKHSLSSLGNTLYKELYG